MWELSRHVCQQRHKHTRGARDSNTENPKQKSSQNVVKKKVSGDKYIKPTSSESDFFDEQSNSITDMFALSPLSKKSNTSKQSSASLQGTPKTASLNDKIDTDVTVTENEQLTQNGSKEWRYHCQLERDANGELSRKNRNRATLLNVRSYTTRSSKGSSRKSTIVIESDYNFGRASEDIDGLDSSELRLLATATHPNDGLNFKIMNQSSAEKVNTRDRLLADNYYRAKMQKKNAKFGCCFC